jgi:hypothetical protein
MAPMTRLEALLAGKKAFYRLNTYKDRTLEADELAGRMSTRAFDEADSIIKDGKVGLIEYLREVKNRFHWSNLDKDRTIECDELHTKYGRLLYPSAEVKRPGDRARSPAPEKQTRSNLGSVLATPLTHAVS